MTTPATTGLRERVAAIPWNVAGQNTAPVGGCDEEWAVSEYRDAVLKELDAALAASPDDGSGSQDGLRHQHRWPVLPNPTCMWIGCPGNEIEDFHEHCADCGAINPDSIYEDDDGQHHRYRLAHNADTDTGGEE